MYGYLVKNVDTSSSEITLTLATSITQDGPTSSAVTFTQTATTTDGVATTLDFYIYICPGYSAATIGTESNSEYILSYIFGTNTGDVNDVIPLPIWTATV